MQTQVRQPDAASVAAPRPPETSPVRSAPSAGGTPQGTVPVVVVQAPEPGDAGVKEWLEFGQAFAWPLTLVTLAILFRKQIAAKIENMASLKTPVAESTWNAQASTVADLAEGIVETEATATPEPGERPLTPDPAVESVETVAPTHSAASPPRRYEGVMPDTSNTEAVGAVILLWNAVEQAVRDLAASRNVDAKNFLQAYRWLTRTNVIPPTTVELIDQLRKLRNEVVHLRGTEIDSEAYRRSVLAVLESLDLARHRPPPPPRSIASM